MSLNGGIHSHLTKGSVVGLLVIGILAIAGFSPALWSLHDREERHAELSVVADAAFGIVKELRRRSGNGDITEEEAKSEALETLRPIRYRDSNFYLVIDHYGQVILHPAKPSFEGKNVIGLKDVEGGYFIKKLIATAQEPEGRGCVIYVWKKPDRKSYRRMSCVRNFAPWKWAIIASGFVDGEDPVPEK